MSIPSKTAALVLSAFFAHALGLAQDTLRRTGKGTFLPRSFVNKTFPKWENGLFLVHDNDNSGVAAPNVFAYDSTGRLKMQAAVRFPDAVSVRVVALAGSPRGIVVAAGRAFDASGTPGPFLAWIGGDGRIQRVVRTFPYAAYEVCFAPDGSVWTLGRDAHQEGAGEPPHDVLRRFSAEGHMVQSLLPRDGFAKNAGRHPLNPTPHGGAFLAAGRDRVVVFSTSAAEWVEVVRFRRGDRPGRETGRAPA